MTLRQKVIEAGARAMRLQEYADELLAVLRED